MTKGVTFYKKNSRGNGNNRGLKSFFAANKCFFQNTQKTIVSTPLQTTLGGSSSDPSSLRGVHCCVEPSKQNLPYDPTPGVVLAHKLDSRKSGVTEVVSQ